ncbi:PT repeat family protein [Diplocarpon rosae]|nr:PT repeat family protein [Diplocarpon rosae]
MTPTILPVTIRYAKPGTQPPLYLGGSFDSPPWHDPRAMQYTTDENNEHHFYTEVHVEEGREYQYKFRLGPGNWWVLNEDAPTGGKKSKFFAFLFFAHLPKQEERRQPDHRSLLPPSQFLTTFAVSDNQGIRNNLLSVPGAAAHNPRTRGSTPAATHTRPPTREEPAPATAAAAAAAAEMETPAGQPAEEAMDTRETADVLFSDEITQGPEGGGGGEASWPVTPGLVEPTEPHPTPAPGFEQNRAEMFQDVPDRKMSALPRATLTSGAVEPHPTPATGLDQPTAELLAGVTGWQTADPIEPPALAADGPEKTERETAAQRSPDATDQDAGGDAAGTSPLPPPPFSSSPPPPLLVVEQSAAALDRDAPTPPLPDAEAGRLGYRRMSQTPIPEVAATAAEVADVAATLDRSPSLPQDPVADVAAIINGSPVTMKELGDLLEARGYAAIMNDESIQFPATPPNEKVPLFPHEGGAAPEPTKTRRRKASHPATRRPSEPVVYDPNDPTIKKFPEDREGILRELALMQARLPPDTHDCVGGVDSDITEEIHCPGKPISPVAHPAERSPSLDSIAEENDDEPEPGWHAVKVPDSTGSAHLHAETAAQKPTASLPPTTPATPLHDATQANGELAQPELEGAATAAAAADGPVASSRGGGASPPPGDPNERSVADSLDGAESGPLPVAPPQIPATPFVVGGNRQLGHPDEDGPALTSSHGPSILVEPATPGPSAQDDPLAQPVGTSFAAAAAQAPDGEPTTAPASGLARTTAWADEHGTSNTLRSRSSKHHPSAMPDRPRTPTSLRSTGKDVHSRNFLKAFWRVVFVEWIGGLIMRLCGGRDRRT